MEPELSIIQQPQTGKIYKDRAIYVGTFLGGPLVAGYLIANNFKVFNEPVKVKKTWIYTIIATIIIIIGAFLISNIAKTSGPLIPIIYAIIAYYLVKSFQGKKIDTFINSGGSTYSWWRTILISVIGLIITIIPIFLVVFLMSAATPTAKDYRDVQSYGMVKNEVFFNNKTISNTEVNKIADALTKTGFFNEDGEKFVYVKEVGTDYDISIVVNNLGKAEQLYPVFVEFRNQLQTLLPNHKIVILLVRNNINNVIKSFE